MDGWMDGWMHEGDGWLEGHGGEGKEGRERMREREGDVRELGAWSRRI